MTDSHLAVTFTRTFDRKPLAVVHNLPGGDAEMQPYQLRGLAAVLVRAAADCEAQYAQVSQHKRHEGLAARRDYALDQLPVG